MYSNMKQVNQFFESRKRFGIQLGLERIEQMLFRLGNPEKDIPSIHVAGTNGKGSTIHYLKTALIQSGYNVGVFTSPSMTDLRGHIFLNNKSISTEMFIKIINSILPNIENMDRDGLHVTEFEILSVIAFIYFNKTVDIALIEAGMGGRGDTTNCINPILTIITNVGLDHTSFLGPTIANIAYQKAGIIKDNIPVIIGHMQLSAIHEILKEVKKTNSELYQIDKEFTYEYMESKKSGEDYVWSDGSEVLSVSLKMNGKHQIENSSLALQALILLIKKGYHIDLNNVLKCFSETQLIGRFEQVAKDPTIIIDGAHNLDGMKSFTKLVEEKYQHSNKILVFGSFKDKAIEEMIELAIPKFDQTLLTSFKHSRAADYNYLNELAQDLPVSVIDDWELYLTKITKNTIKTNNIYFVAGSLNFITQVRQKLFDHSG